VCEEVALALMSEQLLFNGKGNGNERASRTRGPAKVLLVRSTAEPLRSRQ